MSANVEAMVREGINAYKSGRRDEARALLLKATELDQYNEQAWLWLSGLMDTPDDQRTCLENVLAINPSNERARQGLSFLTGQTSAGSVSPFSASAPPSEPSSPGTTATSVDWGAPASISSVPDSNQPRPGEPTGAVLDDWVSNLNLPSSESSSSTPAFMRSMAVGASSPFGDFDLNDDDDNATFTSGPFGGAALTFDDDARAPEMSVRYPVSSPMSPTPTTYTPPPPEPERTRRARLPNSPPPPESSALYTLDNRRDSNVLEDEGGEMFGYIPPEISPTRLPGTVERTPILLRLGVVLLVIINLALAVGAMIGIMT